MGAEGAGSAFLSCAFRDLSEIGRLETEEGQVWSLRGSDAQDDSSVRDRVLLVAVAPEDVQGKRKNSKNVRAKPTSFCSASVTPGDEWRWTEPLFANIAAERVVVLQTVRSVEIPLQSAVEGKPSSPFLFHLRTASGSGPVWDTPVLPSPILLEGLGASILAHCESAGVPAVSLVSLVERSVDSLTLVAYERAFSLGGDGKKAAAERRQSYKEALRGGGGGAKVCLMGCTCERDKRERACTSGKLHSLIDFECDTAGVCACGREGAFRCVPRDFSAHFTVSTVHNSQTRLDFFCFQDTYAFSNPKLYCLAETRKKGHSTGYILFCPSATSSLRTTSFSAAPLQVTLC